jgi:hypothetical protein
MNYLISIRRKYEFLNLCIMMLRNREWIKNQNALNISTIRFSNRTIIKQKGSIKWMIK